MSDLNWRDDVGVVHRVVLLTQVYWYAEPEWTVARPVESTACGLIPSYSMARTVEGVTCLNCLASKSSTME